MICCRLLDYENLVRHTVIISAQDSGNPQLSANLTLVVDVQDINDNSPVFEHDTYTANVLESDAVKTKVRTSQHQTRNSINIVYFFISYNTLKVGVCIL